MGSLSRIHAKLGDLWWYTILLFIAQRIGDVINMFVGLWIVPKYVPMEELGAVLPMTNIVSLIGIPLSVVSIPFLKFVAVFAERGELGKVKALIRDAFVGTAVFSLLTIVFAYFCLPFFFERLRIQNGSLMFLLIVVTVAGSVATIFTNALSGLKMFDGLVWFQALAAPVRLLFMIVFMPFRALSGYVVGQGAAPFTYILGSLFALKRFFSSTVVAMPYWKAHRREIVSYTWPLLVSAVVGAVAGNLNTLVIRHRLSDFESAGYYMITRFSDISVWVGMAFSAFLMPLLAGTNGEDERSRKLLVHSVAGTLGVGLLITVLLWAGGRWILDLQPEWTRYSILVPQMVLLSLSSVLGVVGNCVVTAFTARSRFCFFLYYLPLTLGSSMILYALTGCGFFDGMVPETLLGAVRELNPCRLDFIVKYGVATQLVVDACLCFHAFACPARDCQ